MSLPAPTGLGVAGFRAGLARGVAHSIAASRPALRSWLGRAAPGEYRSSFPARLRLARAAAVVLALLWLAAGWHGLDATGDIVRTVGHDTAPSVSAAEAIRTGLASADADFALSALSNEASDGPELSAMRLHLRGVRAAIVAAAGNVTYGDEERGPIQTLLQGIGDYEQLVGRATASAGDARRDLAFAADDLLHWTALPAAVTLERVNADHLAEAYRDYGGRHVVAWLSAAAALLVLLLLAVQVDVARTAKRLLTPGLAVATLAVAGITALIVWRLLAAQADLRVAKADAFDSVYALTTADALATDFDGDQTFFLLATGDGERQARYAAGAASLARRLLGVDPAAAVEAVRGGGGADRGYIGDELANVTFPGEAKAAAALVRAWDGVLRADEELRANAGRGQRALAVSSKTTAVAGGARAAFSRFDAALAEVLAINRAEFGAHVAAAERDDAPLGAALVVGFVLALAAAWFGIGRRLDEYRF